MVKKLSIHQRRFLEYIASDHKHLGKQPFIQVVLERGLYEVANLDILRVIIKRFNWLRIEMETGDKQDHWYTLDRYNTPTKYLG